MAKYTKDQIQAFVNSSEGASFAGDWMSLQQLNATDPNPGVYDQGNFRSDIAQQYSGFFSSLDSWMTNPRTSEIAKTLGSDTARQKYLDETFKAPGRKSTILTDQKPNGNSGTILGDGVMGKTILGGF